MNTSPQVPLTLADGLVAVSPEAITNTFAVDRYYRTPYAQTWNLTIQHDLGKGFFMEVGYLGTKGTRLDVLTLPNEGPPGSHVPFRQPARQRHRIHLRRAHRRFHLTTPCRRT